MPVADPSDPSFVAPNVADVDLVVGGEKIACDRRMPRKNPPRYSLLSDSIRAQLPPSAFEVSIPVDDDGAVDLARVRAELAKTPRLGTIVVSRAGLREMTRGKDPVGELLPVFGQIRNPSHFDPKSALSKNCAPVDDREHAFAFAPVVIATTGETPGDQGEIVYQGVVVSNKSVNRAVGDSRRRTMGRNPVFEESLCFVMVTHAYDPPFRYAALGPHATRKRKDGTFDVVVEDGRRNAYDSVFEWNAFMNARKTQRGCGVSTFGFTDTKQSGKDVVRYLFPWPISHAARVLAELRRGDLRAFLVETPMTLAGKRAAAREECPSGIDVRRFLLAELLLKGTPMEPLLEGREPAFEFAAPTV